MIGRKTKTGPIIEFHVGEGVPADNAQWLKERLEEGTPFQIEGLPARPTIFDLYAAHDMDLSTFKFSVYWKELAPATPFHLGYCRQVPGRIKVQWGNDNGCHDLVSVWASPCTRRTSNVFFSWLNQYRSLSSAGHSTPGLLVSLLQEIVAHGFKEASLRLEVFHKNSPRLQRGSGS